MKTIDITDFSGGKNTFDDQILAKENQCVSSSMNVWTPRRALTKTGGVSIYASFTASGSSSTYNWFAFEPSVTTAHSIYHRLQITSNTNGCLFGGSSDSLTPLGYTTGTVSISGASLISATGSGTSWSTHVSASDRFRVDASSSSWYAVSSVEDDTHLTLGTAVPSAVATGSAYTVQPAISAAEVAHAVLNGKLLSCSTANIMQMYDGTGVTRLTSAPKAAFLAVFKNYLFGLRTSTAESRLYWSAVGDPTSWPANSSADVDRDNGKGTGLFPYGNELIVFKQRGMFRVVGDVFDSANPTFGIYPIPTPGDFLFNSNWSCAVVNGVLYFTSRWAMYSYSGGGSPVVRVSQKFQDDLGDTRGALNDVATSDQRIFGISYLGNYLIKGLLGAQATAEGCGIVDPNGSWWKAKNINVNGAINSADHFEPISKFAIIPNTAGTPQLLLNTRAAPRLFQWDLYSTTASAQYIQTDTSFSNIAINGVWISKEFNLEFAAFKKIVIYLAKQTAGNLTVEWSVDQGTFVSKTIDMTVGRGNLIRKTLDINQRGSTIQLRLSNNTVNQNFKIYAIRVYYEPDEEARLA